MIWGSLDMPLPAKFERKNIRLSASRYLGRGLYFVTLCFDHRRKLGANPRIASWIIERLRSHATACRFSVHAYCVMPDHVHMLAAGTSEESNLVKFVESVKQDTGAAFARRTGKRLWQFKYYDHILRASDSADRVAQYIWMNPVRRGLCGEPSEYAHLGSFTKIGRQMLHGSAVPEWSPPWRMTRRVAAGDQGCNSE